MNDSVMLDRLEEIKSSLIGYMDDFKEKLDDCYDMMHNSPCDVLNRLISSGFVPGARYVYENIPLTFIGYTELLSMDFQDERNGSHYYVDISATSNRLEKFAKREANNG